MMDNLLEVKTYIDMSEVRRLAWELESKQDEGETAKHRHIAQEYIKPDMNGVDLGSAGVPVVPWAIQVDLPSEDYRAYNPTRGEAPIHWRGSALDLPFKDGTLDFCHASHLLEDFEEWGPPLAEWSRVLKVGGNMIIAVPDRDRFRERVRRAREDHGIDVDNMSHRHESRQGEVADYLLKSYDTLFDGFVSDSPLEYSLLYVGRKR